MKLLIILLSVFIINFSNAQTIRFMAGIEKDLTAQKQCDIVKSSLPNHKVQLYKRGEYKRLIRDSYRDTTSIIILFSAGCKDSYSVIESVLCDVWIVEPHISYGENIRKCISIGFPKSKIVLGPYKERGFGISNGCRRTPDGLGHFKSLEWVCGLIRKEI
jgi:hypothetical protein